MNKLISLAEPMVEFPLRSGERGELFATAEGSYDSQRELLCLELGAEVLSSGTPVIEQRPPWLPEPQALKEHVPLGEATTLARDIFRHWVDKVRRRIPADLHVNYAAAAAS